MTFDSAKVGVKLFCLSQSVYCADRERRDCKKVLRMIQRPFNKLILICLLIALVVIAASLFWRWYRFRDVRSANLLLDKAYVAHRTLELRFEGSEFSPFSKTADWNQRSNILILQARAKISEHNDFDDPEWNHLRGKLFLLLGDPAAAAAALERAHEFQPNSASVLIDLASAYFEKGSTENSDINLGIALAHLAQALALDPGNHIALYNSAVIEEKQFLYRTAVRTWRQYLRVAPPDLWAEEVKSHLNSIEEKLNEHTKRLQAPLLTPELISTAFKTNASHLYQEMEERVEEYSDAAVLEWLPQAYGTQRNPAAIASLQILAKYLFRVHHDSWLIDLLASTPRSKNSAAAIQLLVQSMHANVDGNPLKARALAGRAHDLFLVVGSMPGALNASVEEINSFRQQFKSADCIETGQKIQGILEKRGYQQLLARTALEVTGCQLRVGDQMGVAASLRRASIAVQKGQFPSQQINTWNYQSALEITKGDFVATWQISCSALAFFWKGLFPDKRAYPFYIRLSEWAEENNQPFLFYAFAQEAADTIDATDLVTFQAMAHYHFAEAAMASGNYEVANNQIARSEKIFSGLPATDSSAIYRLEIEILLAKLEARKSEYASAMTRLNDLEPLVKRVESFLIKYQFYSTRAAILADEFQNGPAESDYRSAITAAESLLKSVQGERQRLAWSYQYGPVYRGLSQILLRQNRLQEALQIWEQYRASDLRSFASTQAVLNPLLTLRSGHSLDLEAVQEKLDKEAILVYMLTDDGLAAWAITKHEIQFRFSKVDRQKLADSAKHLAFLCRHSESNLNDIRSQGQHLYQMLLQPFQEAFKNRPLVIEPDEELAVIPFEALVDDAGEYLIQHHTVTYLPSVLYMDVLRPKDLEMNSSVLAVGVSGIPEKYRQKLVPLPQAESEAESVGGQMPNTRLLVGSNANSRNILQWIAAANVFHFAGHSVYEHGRLDLLLPDRENGEGDLLNLGELSQTKLKSCRLVVLSACSTEGLSGESFHEPQNIIRSLLQARVSRIVASRWEVESSFTAKFMKEFYRRLTLNESIGRSFAETVNQSREQYPHPYYWAAFSQFGRN
jgi:CHAT domain-containing protein/cytochrome c-type biogenesis protein CcmH/NrfG